MGKVERSWIYKHDVNLKYQESREHANDIFPFLIRLPSTRKLSYQPTIYF